MISLKTVTNRRTGGVLAAGAATATGRRDRRRGLIGRDRLGNGEALIIPACRQVHTFGMKFPVDIAFVGRDGSVLRTCRRLGPGRLSPLVLRSRMVIEMEAGVLDETGTRHGDRLLIEDSVEGKEYAG